jgi:hypothetical protein
VKRGRPRLYRPKVRAVVVVFAAFGVAMLLWLAVNVVQDLQLRQRGIVVTATVENIRGNEKYHDCLASFALDGVAYRQWAHKMPGCRVGDRTAIIVDPHDRSSLQSTKAYHDRWFIYIIQGVMGLFFGWLAISIHDRVSRTERFLTELEGES